LAVPPGTFFALALAAPGKDGQFTHSIIIIRSMF
jgi:hypothetical protein